MSCHNACQETVIVYRCLRILATNRGICTVEGWGGAYVVRPTDTHHCTCLRDPDPRRKRVCLRVHTDRTYSIVIVLGVSAKLVHKQNYLQPEKEASFGPFVYGTNIQIDMIQYRRKRSPEWFLGTAV